MLYTLIIFACVALIIFACIVIPVTLAVAPDYTGPARTPTSSRWPPDPIPQPVSRKIEFRVKFTVEIGDIYSEPVVAFPDFPAFVRCLGGPARDVEHRGEAGLLQYPRTRDENGYCGEPWPRDRHYPSYECFNKRPACDRFDADWDGDNDLYDYALWTRHISSGGHYGIYQGVPSRSTP